jgi:tellurite methyltransferase
MHPYASLPSDTDIYLLDQIMKGRYLPGETILDAGAGAGRNLRWFVEQGYPVTALDRDPEAVQRLRALYPHIPFGQILEDELDDLPFTDGAFHHVICSAVLHFAESEAHFEAMFAELVRVLRPGGSLFIRTATDQGLAVPPVPLGQGRYCLCDGSDRFLMTRVSLDRLMRQHRLYFLEPFKTVLVDDLRSMAVLVLGKEGGMAH